MLESIFILIYGKQYGPVHFSIRGIPDGFGNQKFLLIMPLSGLIVYFGLNWIKKLKHLFNYPVKITPDNRNKQEILIAELLDRYALFTLLIFNLLSLYMIYTLYSEQSREIWIIFLLFVIGYTLPLIAYLKEAFHNK